MACYGSPGWQLADLCGPLVLGAEPVDLVVLAGELGERAVLEVTQIGDRVVAVGKTLPERGDLVLEAGDLCVTAVGEVAGLLAGLEPGLELLAEMVVGPGAVEGGTVHGCFAGEGFDVTFAAGRDLAAEELVHDGPDPGLVPLALFCADAHF